MRNRSRPIRFLEMPLLLRIRNKLEATSSMLVLRNLRQILYLEHL